MEKLCTIELTHKQLKKLASFIIATEEFNGVDLDEDIWVKLVDAEK